jgi:putative hydrolase of the HAD superfamily
MKLCLVFDLDDTLFVEQDYVWSGFQAVGCWARRSLGVVGFADAAWRVFQHGRRGRVFDEALRRSGISPTAELVARMVRIYREHRPTIALAGDAARCLRFFQRRAALALISDGPLVSQGRKVEALGLAAWMSPIVLTARWGEAFCKPHRAAFDHVSRCRGPGSWRFVYVGDNPAKDFQAPRALGWDTVRIRRAGGLHAESPASGEAAAKWEIASLDELKTLLGVSCLSATG